MTSGTATTIYSRSCSERAGPSRAGPCLSPPRSRHRLVRGERAARGGDRVRTGSGGCRPGGAAGRALGQPVYQGGRVATVERWLDWLERHGALNRNAAVAVLGALIAVVQGRPAEAERWAEIAERASYDGVLYDGSASIASWLALLSALRCRRVSPRCGQMRNSRSGSSLAGASSGRPLCCCALAPAGRRAGSGR